MTESTGDVGPLRREPFIWATWLSKALSSDDACGWKPWAKAHFEYRKRTDDRANDLSEWKRQHGELLEGRASALEQVGWTVRLEQQNEFSVRGKTATVKGVADLVATRAPAVPERAFALTGEMELVPEPVLDVRIEDAKTGQRRDADFWQVVLYLLFLPTADKRLRDTRLSGAVVYRDGTREITQAEAEAKRDIVIAKINALATGPEPRRVPSAQECRMCDIAGCPDRVTAASDLTANTEAF